MYEIHTGTPNEMTKAASEATQPSAVKWARDYLQTLEKQADRYDRAALERIRSTREQMLQTTPISRGDKRTWEFEYISITVRIELRRT